MVNTGLPWEGSEIFHRSCQPPLERRYASPCAGNSVTFTQKLTVAVGEFKAEEFGAAMLALMLAPNSPGRIGDVELTIAAGGMGFGLIAYVGRQATKPMPRGEMDYMILGDFASSRQAK